MNFKKFNAYCKSLPATTFVEQWGGCQVWKVAEKVFAIGTWADEEEAYTFKVSPWAFEVLKEQEGLRPAPYLASRGMSWIQHYAKPGLNDELLKKYLKESYNLVLQGVSKKKRTALGLLDEYSTKNL
ncbi:MAG: MmcQ/YjbR family DNA-binding protein [Candidatus Obscuribacterales bacterium]|nr:MmcQ/YjbR family DNA-binding protein [Candidatus Obscuribacterales bacterium]